MLGLQCALQNEDVKRLRENRFDVGRNCCRGEERCWTRCLSLMGYVGEEMSD